MMRTLYTLLLILFVLDCALLMIVILLQDSKGSGLAGAFGGGMTTQLLGGRGAATFLSRATTYLGTAFLVLSLLTSLMPRSSMGDSRSLILDESGQTGAPIPQTGLPLLPGSSLPGLPASSAPDTGGS